MLSKTDLLQQIKNGLLTLKVIPNSKAEKLVLHDGEVKLHLQAVPEKDKANKALIKFFKDNYNLSVLIKSGEKARNKVLQIVS